MSTTPDASVTQIAEEIAQLRDLFQRRLLEDRAKQRLYDELYTQLEFAKSGLTAQFIAPIAREILLVIDRIESATQQTQDLTSIAEELREILHRRGLREVNAVGAPFDPRIHEAVDRAPVDHAADDGRIIAQRRPGYVLDGQVLRPAQVTIGKLPDRNAEGAES